MLLRRFGLVAAFVLASVLFAVTATAQTTAPTAGDTFAAAVAGLAAESFPEKSAAVTALSELKHPNGRAVLAALLDGKLYFRVADNKVYITDGGETALSLTDPLTLAAAGSGEPDDFSRITTNNSLRKTLRSAVATFALSDPDADVRLAAVREMLRSIDDDSVAILRTSMEKEADADVRKAMREGLALADLDSADADTRLTAVAALKDSLSPDVYNRLTIMVTADDAGSFPEPDERVRTTAREVISAIDSSRQVYATLETLFFGLSLGSVLVLAAIGLAITFGVMGVINMAHGELMMLGAYTTYVVQQAMPNHIGLSIFIAIPLAFLVSACVGMLIERGVVRFLYGRPLETLLATFGVSLILQQVVRDVFSANNRPVETPAWMAGSMQINEALSITYNRLYVILFMIVVFVVLQMVLQKTSLGLKVRAVAQNRNMARAMGVRTQWVDAMTFGLGSGIAGVAGVALSQLTNVGPNLGQQYIIDSFMVVVFGGVGNLWGTLIGGMSLGVVSKVLEPWAGAVLAKILVLIALILFIQRRPRGLFPQKGRAAEN
ncbi:MAG TPA: urea ABC transporter permease subunit UrtB [Steroidobacteraceae bacterium]|nr:urea ABC transporter permease subunit UrtB [Steroidobacteraceae bacterium]